MSNLYSINEMNSLAIALEKAKFTPRDIAKLGPFLSEFQKVLRGDARVIPIKRFIDTNTPPLPSDGFNVESHIQNGLLEWDSNMIRLYLYKHQENGTRAEGKKLMEQLEKKAKPTLNSNVLDFLLLNP